MWECRLLTHRVCHATLCPCPRSAALPLPPPRGAVQRPAGLAPRPTRPHLMAGPGWLTMAGWLHELRRARPVRAGYCTVYLEPSGRLYDHTTRQQPW